jgi:23S rRNA U2552 (ribose-2'-O)-methylase RlmE/FtsJ
MAYKKGESGNIKGKPKGLKAKKTLEWESLSESIINKHSAKFNEILTKLFDSKDSKEQQKGVDTYLQVLEYFKPKQSRVESTVKSEEVTKVTFVHATKDS